MNEINRLLIATSWYSDPEKHKDYGSRSKKVLEANWIRDYWQPYIERFVMPEQYFCYISNCDIMPCEDTFLKNWNYVIGYDYAKKLDHRHDYHAALMVSLQYAYANELDWVSIEQDCLVYGLDKVVQWARDHVADKLIIFGWKPWCFQKDWAEQSLMYCPFHAIPTVLYFINRAMVHVNNIGVPEKNWYNLFKGSFVGWPFGYGRHTVDDWSREMFFKQQVSDNEIDKFFRIAQD